MSFLSFCVKTKVTGQWRPENPAPLLFSRKPVDRKQYRSLFFKSSSSPLLSSPYLSVCPCPHSILLLTTMSPTPPPYSYLALHWCTLPVSTQSVIIMTVFICITINFFFLKWQKPDTETRLNKHWEQKIYLNWKNPHSLLKRLKLQLFTPIIFAKCVKLNITKIKVKENNTWIIE